MAWPTKEELFTWMKVTQPSQAQQQAADLLLSLAVGTAKRVARQQLEHVPGDEVELRGTHRPVLQLPERPVTAVAAAAIEDTHLVPDIDFTWDRLGRLKRASHQPGVSVPAWRGGWGGPHATVHVTYSHGYEEIPDDVRRIVLASAARGLVNPGGHTQRSVGNYSESFGRVGLTSGFTDLEVEILKSYRPRS